MKLSSEGEINFGKAVGASQADLADEKLKSQALSRKQEDALRAAKGGSVLFRIARAAKWFTIGAAGAIAAKSRQVVTRKQSRAGIRAM
jgi:hypothetical protein